MRQINSKQAEGKKETKSWPTVVIVLQYLANDTWQGWFKVQSCEASPHQPIAISTIDRHPPDQLFLGKVVIFEPWCFVVVNRPASDLGCLGIQNFIYLLDPVGCFEMDTTYKKPPATVLLLPPRVCTSWKATVHDSSPRISSNLHIFYHRSPTFQQSEISSST